MAMDLFNQGMRVTLINALKRILDQYPNNGQILKEILQNAEDAGAHHVKFLLDETHYGDATGVSPDDPAYPYLGPALYVYNDASLTDNDWKGISDIEGSIKANDPTTIGRFGLGFKSVFHLTDVPSIYSGNNLGFLDPHEQLLRNDGYRVPVYGYCIHAPSPDCPGKKLFQEGPYQHDIFNSKQLENYPHTILRFPLRTKDHSSKLSSDGCSVDEIWQLLETLCKESHMNLLFMKNIENIEVYRKSFQCDRPFLHFKVELAGNMLEETQRGRAKTKEIMRHDWRTSAAHTAFRMCLKESKFLENGDHKAEIKQWLVCNYVDAGKNENEMGKLAEDLHLIPMVGVAVPLEMQTSEEVQGHLYCCLPLPLEGKSPTGLPVHINGHFVLDQTRHHLKWSTTDHDTARNKEVEWNECLVSQIIPKAYIQLVLELKCLIQKSGNDKEIVQAWLISHLPCKHSAEPHWENLVDEFYRLYCGKRLILAGNGRWVLANEAWYLDTNMEQTLKGLLHQLLCHLNESVAELPEHVIKGINDNIITPFVSPAVVRRSLKYKQLPKDMSTENKLKILNYILRDQRYQELTGVELLPLSNGEFIVFSAESEETIFLDSEDHPQELLPGMDSIFLARPNDEELQQRMRGLAESGHTQLTVFGASAFRLHLRDVHCYNKSQVWFELIWKYITLHFPNSLDQFEGLLILPVTLHSGNAEHLRLEPDRAWLLLSESKDAGDCHVQHLLEVLGVKVIKSVNCRAALSHPTLLGHYIKENSLNGVLSCLEHLSDHLDHRQLASDFLTRTSGKEKQSFMVYCSRISSALGSIGSAKLLLRSLALFQKPTIAGDMVFTSCEETPTGCSEIPPFNREEVIDVSTMEAQILAKALGLDVIDVTKLLTEYILPSVTVGKYTENEVNQIIRHIFSNHLTRNREICLKLEILEFVTTLAGNRRTPASLFDPTDNLLKPFLKAENVPGEFKEYMDQLKRLGLKTADTISARDVLLFAQCIPSDIHAGNALVELITYRPEILKEIVDGKEFGLILESMRWVPVKQKAPDDYPQGLDWCGSSMTLAKPTEVISSDYQYLTGALAPVTDCSHDSLVDVYKWKQNPNMDMIVQQLHCLFRFWQQGDVPGYSVSSMTQKIYCYLTGLIRMPLTIQVCLKIRHMIWTGKEFVTADKILLDPPLPNMEPYIYKVPEEFKTFKVLFTKCGMKDSCDLIEILKEIQGRHMTTEMNDVDVKRDRALAISILGKLSVQNLGTSVLDGILLPIWTSDDTLKMCELRDCAYDDRIWRPGFSPSTDDIQFVHPSIPLMLAEALQVRTLVSQVLDVKELDFEDFGQSEPLTCRLKNILEEYPDGFSVSKELIQNADDAGATEVSFVFDERHHKKYVSKLFDSNMAQCQGQALFVYNNAQFTEKDFENVIKLGGRTKEDQMDKIGRFGLGFNAVYHLTDVPTFISGSYLVMLDPHMSHLGKCIRRNPGIRIDIGRKKAVKQFSDQYQPYEGIHGCSILSATGDGYCYPGTLFRFPLRTEQQAETSDICQNAYDKHEMKKFLKLFIENIDTCLLFTENVKKLTIFRLHKDAKGFDSKTLLCKVEKKNVKLNSRTQCDFLRSGPSPDQILKTAAHLVTRNKNEEVTFAAIIEMDCQTTNDAMEYLQLEKEYGRENHWLICQHANGQILNPEIKKKLKSPAPVGGVAVKLLAKASMFLPKAIQNGKIFCFLPLPQKNCLPIHINGCFAVSSNRRNIVEPSSEDKDSLRGKWNELLLERIVGKAYVKAIEMLTDISGTMDFDIWPNCATVSDHGVVLARSVLTNIAHNKTVRVFTDGEIKRNFSGMAFLKKGDFCFEENGVNKDCEYVVRDILHCVLRKQEIAVVNMPQFVYESFQKVGIGDEINKKMYTKEMFFEKVFLQNIEKIDRSARDKIMQMAILCNNTKINKLLQNVRCIPVSPDGLFCKFPSEILYPKGDVAEMFMNEDGRFPYPGTNGVSHRNISFCTEEMLRGLERIGMPRDEVKPADIIERASSVMTVPVEIGLKRSRKIIQFLPRLLNDTNSSFFDKLKEIPFLPAMDKPEMYPLPWYASKDKFCKPKGMFTSREKYRVGCVASLVEEELFPGQQMVGKYLGITGKRPDVDLIKKQFGIILVTDISRMESYEEKNEFQKCFCETFREIAWNVQYGQKDVNDFVLNHLKQKPSILVSDRFVEPRSCALNFEGKCEPWLNKVPQNIQHGCTRLLQMMGVGERFTLQHYIQVLDQMHQIYAGNGLDPSSLDAAVTVVQYLIKQADKSKVYLQEERGVIYIPDTESVLRPCTELCLFDPDFETDDDVRHPHPDLSFQASLTLCHIGVKTAKEHTLGKHTLGIPFGQSEKLQNRIMRILTGYPCDTTIMKELLQNADDAGATELHFILDPRTHPSEKIFDDRMKPLQGPALCVYNNRPFTRRDLEGIKNLGEGSKSEDATKAGQYGVGFNCVYHITDTPIFLTHVEGTGEVMVMFDPTCHYVPGATALEPGKMYKDLDYLRTRFPDVFKAFSFENFPVHDGTIFRLPLRTPNTAISNWLRGDVSLNLVSSLLETFKGEARNCLLFLKNVNKVSVSHVEKTGAIINDYWVESRSTKEDHKAKAQFFQVVNTDARYLKQKKIDINKANYREVQYISNVRDANGLEESWAVVQAFGFKGAIPREIIYAHAAGRLGFMLPQGGVAGLIKDGNKTARKRCNVYEDKRYIYSFLPLPLPTKLPVHLNGHFALDHESRRNLWGPEGDPNKSKWNRLIMSQILAPAYVSFMLFIQGEILDVSGEKCPLIIQDGKEREMYERKISHYNTFFPPDDRTLYVQDCVDEFYRRSYNNHVALFAVFWKPRDQVKSVVEWFDVNFTLGKQAVFKDFKATGWSKESLINTDQMEKTLEGCGYLMFQTPRSVHQKFQMLGLAVNFSSPENVFSFFLSYDCKESTCHLRSLPQNLKDLPVKDTSHVIMLIRYCSSVKDFHFRLQGLPLLVTNDEKLHIFDERNPVFCTNFSHVFQQLKHKFMHDDLRNEFLKNVEVSNIRQVKKLLIPEVAKLLPNILDKEILTCSRTYIEWSPEENMSNSYVGISMKWLHDLWALLFHCLDGAMRSKQADFSQENIGSLFLQTMRPIGEWHLLPAKSLKSNLLLPLKSAKLVTDFSCKGNIKAYINGSLAKLDLPVPHLRFWNDQTVPYCLSVLSVPYYLSVLRSLYANTSDPEMIISAIHKWQEHSPMSVCSNIDKHDVENILEYFNMCVDIVKKIQHGRSTLRRMLLFETCEDQTIALDQKQAVTIPEDIPEFIGALPESETVFLQLKEKYKHLYSLLSIKHLTVFEVYSSYIFKNFRQLKAEEQLQHMKHLCQLLEFIERTEAYSKNTPRMEGLRKDKEVLLSELRVLPFIQFEGELCCASQFYDPTNPVFNKLLPRSKFPPNPYWDPRHPDYNFLKFLQKIGLVTKVSQEELLSFSRNVADIAKSRPPVHMTIVQWKNSIGTKAKAILDNLYESQEKNVKLFQQMSTIAFVPIKNVDCDLEALHKQHGIDTGFSSLANGFICARNNSDIEELLWTSANLFDASYGPKDVINMRNTGSRTQAEREWMLKSMNIRDQPTVEGVVTNVKHICLEYMNSTKHTNGQKEKMKEVLEKSFSFLNPHAKHEEVKQLKKVPCIFVEKNSILVCPYQLSVELKEEDEIPPYLLKVPNYLGASRDLLIELGISKEPTTDQYVNVLFEIRQKCMQCSLHPNELQDCYKAVLGLMILLSRGERFVVKRPVYLPSRLHVLRKSNELHYIDKSSFADRVQGFQSNLLFDLKALNKVEELHNSAEVEHIIKHEQSLFNKFSDDTRPKRISEYIIEKLLLDKVEKLDISNCKIAKDLSIRLKSPVFQHGIQRLISVSKCKRNESQETVLAALSSLKVNVLSKVETILTKRDGNPLEDSLKEQPFFFESESGVSTLFIPQRADTTLYTVLAEFFGEMFDVLSERTIELYNILSCELDNIAEYLNYQKLPTGDTPKEQHGLPKPGEFIPIEKHYLLCQGFEHFNVKEFVGYMLEDSDEENETLGRPVFIYAQIIEIKLTCSDNPLRNKCQINTGEDTPKEVSVIDLFKFHRSAELAWQVAPYSGESPASEAVQEKSLDETMKEVTDILEQAWQLGENERKKIIKRLILKWHPDKNLQRQDFCTKVMQHILNEIKRLESPNPHASSSRSGSTSRHTSSWYSESSGRKGTSYEDFFDRMGARAREHRRNEEAFRENLGRSQGRYRDKAGRNYRESQGAAFTGYSGRSYEDWDVPPPFTKKNPQPGVALKLMKQAECNLRAVSRDQERGRESFPEWACYKCHQAVDYALKAAQFAMDANLFRRGQNLIDVAVSLDDQLLLRTTRQLHSLLGGSAGLGEVDPYTSIPHEAYTVAMAERALKLATDIVDLCRKFINLRTGSTI